ncbi:hypothetical protein B0J14DRAFT_579066 [Halenospora varia]|nr:hypothetical protein B0J14DRAFT_579066 [Halenospora varia]
MPSITAPAIVLVTGANGFIAAHCVADLLKNGFAVVATARTEAKVLTTFLMHKHHPNLSVELVPDITAPGCFDEAIRNCDAVLHLAAPFGYSYSNFEKELLIPSIQGTLTICQAAQKTPSVKRVVLTSSFASVYDASKGLQPEKTYTEEDWAPLTYDDGKNAAITPIAYRASKLLAEKTAWDFVKKNDVKWDLVTLCPGMVFGALIEGTINNLKSLNTSNGIVWSLFGAKDIPDTKAPIWTSVTALAAAHTKALTTSEASNQRFLITNGEYDTQEIADILHASPLLPQEAKKRIPVGSPGKRLGGTHYKVDNSKAGRILGVEGPKLDDTVVELVQQLLSYEKEQTQ